MRRTGAVVGAGALLLLTAIPGTAQSSDPCDGWTATTLASGLGVLENLLPDGDGRLLVSEQDEVLALTLDGTATTYLADVDRPGGMRIHDGHLYVNTGDGATSAALGLADGTVTRVDLSNGAREVWSDGLVMPNGLEMDADGNAYVSRSSGDGAAVSRIDADDPGNPETPWADIADTNGLVLSHDGAWLYAATTFNQPARVLRISVADPTVIETVADLAGVGNPLPKGLDDLDIDPDGALYIAANGSGEVLRLDPATGDACVVADGIGNPSAVKFDDGVGFPATNLYVSAFDGTVTELAAPAGAPAPPPVESEPAPSEAPPATDLPATGGGAPFVGLLALLFGAHRRRA